MPDMLHITTPTAWEQARVLGEYRGDTLETEGFIHLCAPEQLAGVRERYYQGRAGLIVLRVESGRLTSTLTWESPPGSAEEFPHLHGPLNLDAVVEAVPLEIALQTENPATPAGEGS